MIRRTCLRFSPARGRPDRRGDVAHDSRSMSVVDVDKGIGGELSSERGNEARALVSFEVEYHMHRLELRRCRGKAWLNDEVTMRIGCGRGGAADYSLVAEQSTFRTYRKVKCWFVTGPWRASFTSSRYVFEAKRWRSQPSIGVTGDARIAVLGLSRGAQVARTSRAQA